MSIMGGLGMMSAGLIGLPGLGYAKDRFASEALQNQAPAVYAEVKASDMNSWLVFEPIAAIDGKRLGEAKTNPNPDAKDLAIIEADLQGDRKTLAVDSVIPGALALIFLAFIVYNYRNGGYKKVLIEEA